MEGRGLASRRMGRNRIRSTLIAFALCVLTLGGGCLRQKPAEIPRGVGVVVVTTEPDGAAIIFDGAVRGVALAGKPVEIRGVRYGRHAIRAEFPGRAPQVVEFDVRAERVPLKVTLTKDGFGRLVVRANPPGAEVFVNSRYYGKAEPTLEISTLAPGEHSMWLRLPGYRMERHSVVVERRRERRYLIVLEKGG